MYGVEARGESEYGRDPALEDEEQHDTDDDGEREEHPERPPSGGHALLIRGGLLLRQACHPRAVGGLRLAPKVAEFLAVSYPSPTTSATGRVAYVTSPPSRSLPFSRRVFVDRHGGGRRPRRTRGADGRDHRRA